MDIDIQEEEEDPYEDRRKKNRCGLVMKPTEKKVTCLQIFEVIEEDLLSVTKIKEESETSKHSFGSSEYASNQLKGYKILNTVHFTV